MALLTSNVRYLALLTLAPALLAQTTNGSIEGRILNGATGAGIGGVGIRLLDRQRTVLTATTDDTGAFRIGGLKEGRYDVSYSKDGYLHTRGDENEVSIHISGSDPLPFNGEMAAYPTLRGRVLDAEAKPMVGVNVQLSPSLSAQSGADGSFIFPKITPGLYTLVARANPPRPGAPAPPDQDRIEPVSTYYPSATDSTQAETIQIRGGMDLTGYDIRLRAAPVQRVRGSVVDASGKPIRALVSLVAPPSVPPFLIRGAVGVQTLSERTVLEQTVPTGEDGAFEFRSVGRGEWQVRAQSTATKDSQGKPLTPMTTSTMIGVGTRDVDRVELRFSQGFPIDVSADYGDAKMRAVRLYMDLIPLDGQPPVLVISGAPNRPASQGRAIPMVESVPPGYYPAAVMMGGRDVQGQVVEVTGPQPIQVVFKSDGGSVRGKVENGAGLFVALIPQEHSGLKIAVAARCNADGTFSIADVPPGDYYAGAFKGATGMTTQAFQNFLAVNATRVKVEPGASNSLELRMARWP